jgi:hypothetical protein
MTTQTDIEKYEKGNLMQIAMAYIGEEDGFPDDLLDNTDYRDQNSGLPQRLRYIDQVFNVLDLLDKNPSPKAKKYGKNSNGQRGILTIGVKKKIQIPYIFCKLLRPNNETETYFFFRIKKHDKEQFKKYKLEKAMIILNLLELLNKDNKGEEIKYVNNDYEENAKDTDRMVTSKYSYTAVILGFKLCGNALSLKYRETYVYENGYYSLLQSLNMREPGNSYPGLNLYPDICTETTPGPQADSPDYALGAAGEEDAKSHYADLNQPDTQGGRKQHFRRGTSSKCHKTHFSKKCHKTHFSKKCHKTLKRKCHKTLKRKCKKTLKRKCKKTLKRK